MIAFDLQAVQSIAHGERGIARFVGELARTLAAEHPDDVDWFLWNDRLPRVDRLDELGLGGRLRSFSEVRGERVDVLHVNSPFELPHASDLMAPVLARRTVATCYDLIPAQFPQLYLQDPAQSVRYRTRLGLLVAADALVTDSQSAADDATSLLGVDPERITVIGAGVDDRFRPPDDDMADRMKVLRELVPGIGARYVLVPTGMDPRKNTEAVVAAYGLLPEAVRERHPLVLSCKLNDDQRQWLDELCRDHGVSGHVLVTGYVADEMLVALYQSAELVVFPSFYEGFGLPVLEARRCGARVICSNASSLPEVLVDERARFNPFVPAEIAALMRRALEDPRYGALLDAIPDAGFTWSRTARRTAGVYRRLAALDHHRDRDQHAPKRFGVVTLLPPTPSGVADHSRRMLEALHERSDVEPIAFVPGAPPGALHHYSYPVRPLASLPTAWAAGELDAVLYCFGNHELHRPFVPMLDVVPGHVLLHDVRVRGAFSHDQLGPIAHHYYDDAITDDHLVVAPIADRAISLLVQSRHAADLVEIESGRSAVDVGPHPCPDVSDLPRADERSGHDTSASWVVTLGAAHESKQTDTVVAAMRLLHERGVRGAVVGHDGERFVSADDDIVAPGQVDDDEFRGWLARATVLVQLRRTSNGESSGVVAHALAHGVPLVVSDLGAMAELPDDVVVKVGVDIDADELAACVGDLIDDPDRRCRLSDAARAFAARETAAAQADRIVGSLFG